MNIFAAAEEGCVPSKNLKSAGAKAFSAWRLDQVEAKFKAVHWRPSPSRDCKCHSDLQEQAQPATAQSNRISDTSPAVVHMVEFWMIR
jgi:hypothetical protein